MFKTFTVNFRLYIFRTITYKSFELTFCALSNSTDPNPKIPRKWVASNQPNLQSATD